MKKAFLFPGQGSQFIGMGQELASQFEVAKDVFSEVDEALGEKLSALMFQGEIQELTLTKNAQPAIMAVSIAILRVMSSNGLDLKAIDLLAGHSLGEYSALCASEVISLTDTAKVLRKRGIGEFPDSITTRGSKHINELVNASRDGYGAFLIFIIQREDCKSFRIARDIDVDYYNTLKKAIKNKLKVLCYDCKFSSKGISINKSIDFKLDD